MSNGNNTYAGENDFILPFNVSIPKYFFGTLNVTNSGKCMKYNFTSKPKITYFKIIETNLTTGIQYVSVELSLLNAQGIQLQ